MFLVKGEIEMDKLNQAEYDAVSMFVTAVVRTGSKFNEEDKAILSCKIDSLLEAYYEDASEDLLDCIRDTREFVEALDC